MKVSELEGQLLDYWVAKAEGHPLSSEWNCAGTGGILIGTGAGDLESYSPSTDWADGGPIIERERMTVWHRIEDGSGDDWNACISLRNGYEETEIGPTLLIAAMRAYVASKKWNDASI